MSFVEGADELAADLVNRAVKITGESFRETGRSARRIVETTKSTVAVRSGRTRRATVAEADGSSGTDWVVGGTTDGSLRRLELGTSKMAAEPALYPAVEAEIPGWTKRIAERAGKL